MKKLTKMLTGLLTCVILITAVTACSNAPQASSGQTSSTGATASDASSADPTAPQDKTYKISWIGAQNNPLCDDPVMIKHWNELFNVEIDFWNIDSANWNDILGTKFAGGEYPDVLYVNSLQNLSNYIDQDLLAVIPEGMTEKYMPKTIEKITKDYKNLMKVGQVDGKQYSLPIGINATNLFREPMCYRGDWMEKVGVTKAPATLEEFEDLMYKFTNDDPDGNGKKDTHGLSSTGFAMVYGAFGLQRSQWNEVDGKLAYSSIQPGMKDALAVLVKWYKDGVIDPEFITGENTGGYWATSNAFVEGRIGYSGLGGYYHWQPGTNVVELEKINPEAAKKITQGQPVTGPDGKSGGVGYALPHPHSVGFSSHMADELDKMAKVMTMYEYWTENFDNWCTARYGIKDEMWHYNEDGVPISDFNAWKEKQGKKDDDSVTLPGIGGHTVLECFIPAEYTAVEQTYQQNWARENGYDKNIIRDEKFVSFPSSGKYQTELDKIESEAYIAIITGKEPLDYFDTFVSDWKSAGGDTLTQEANDWWATMK